MIEELTRLGEQALAAIERAGDMKSLETIKIDYLGRQNGQFNNILKNLKGLAADQKPVVGKLANDLKQQIETALTARLDSLQQQAIEARIQSERVDVTLSGRQPELGHLHPITQVLRQLKAVFTGMGFHVVEGPEVETDFYNFEALNIPSDHPSREMWDSFYLGGHLLLRSHTSPVQVRMMEQMKPPVRVIVPGKCYRRDAVDATHHWQFHQVEGLLVDEGVTFADLKGCLGAFARELFGSKRRTRFRPSYFPFTEPSAEMDIDCFECEGKGCRLCKMTGWIEILGSGMVHPAVLEGVGYDTSKVRGFAFGMGVERIAILRSAIDDIRLFYENDYRFLKQF
jgi:phenylalanyl-tRNA synthetase alpha chain